MDNLKISHKDPATVNKVTTSLSVKYSKVGEMTVRRGKKHDYLGMIPCFSEDGKFIVDMEEYLNEILSGLPKDINGMTTTSTADDLSKTCHAALKSNKERSELFHRVTTQILSVAQYTADLTCGWLYHFN